MNEFKGTPGEWRWDGDPTNYDSENEAPWLVSDSSKPVITGTIEMRNIYDAHLISAAPDLLAALQDFVNSFNSGNMEELLVLRTKSESIINKALNQ